MIIPAQIELEGTTYEILREHSFNDFKQTAISRALVCPLCLSVWAKLRIERDVLLWPTPQFCSQCVAVPDSWHPVPGSLFTQEGWRLIDESLLDALPPELLQREFQLLFKALDNGNFDSSLTDHPKLGKLIVASWGECPT